jgi:CBS domain-containing protein
MGTIARDIMITEFRTLLPDTPIVEAVKLFRNTDLQKSRRLFGMMVTDTDHRLVGMLSMYDILLYMRPKHIHIWGMMDDIDVAGVIDNACGKLKSILVGDIMSSDIVTISPTTHLMMILDIMIKKHIRRLPVLEDQKIFGIVYLSDLFYHLSGKVIEST